MPRPDTEFVHLHVHTDYSLLDGCSRTDRLCQRAAEMGMKALSITDHGALFGLTHFAKQAARAGIKPLLGCEVYLLYEGRLDAEREERARQKSYHMGLLARDFSGYQNLCKLVSRAHIEGFYRNPRTDMQELAARSEGLIGFSGCLAAVIPQFLLRGDFDAAREAAGRFVDIFGREFFFIELMDHGLKEQRRIIPDLLRIAEEFGLKTVATNDVHYVEPTDWAPHDALLCIQTGSKVDDEKRMRYEARQFYLKSREEMDQAFREVPESILNTSAVAEMCDVKLPFGQDHYPVFKPSAEISSSPDRANFDRILDLYVERKNTVLTREDKPPIELSRDERDAMMENGLFLFERCKEGLNARYGTDYDKVNSDPSGASKGDRELCERLDYELAIITGTGFVDYFLIVWDFIDWARRRGIPVGPGRGSGAGCLVAYVLRITDIDPLRFGLLFERMLNLERVSPPDFDVDFCMRRRDEVVHYVREKYGRDRVANIITFGTFGARMIVRDLARVNNIEFAEADRIAKMVPDELNITLEDAVRKSPELGAEIRGNPVAREIIDHGQVIEGMVRNTGKHACGVIIADQPITNLVPVTLQEGDLTTQYPKGPCEDLGLLKMDFLGLKTLTIIADAQDNVRRARERPDFDIESVPLDDPRTFELLNSGRTTGVFQLESGGMQNLCRRIGLSRFEEIIALIALYRPGPMQFIDQFIEGKKDASTVQVPHPLLEELVSETYGVLVYQEQVMQAAQLIAGYTLGGADILRRAMGKKIKEVMDAQKGVFVRGAEETNGIDRATAESIFGLLEKFAQYGFNKSHSAAYAMLSYRTAYLKANYPVEFMAAVLTSEQGNAEKIAHFLAECSDLGIPVLSPNVNESRATFTPVIDGSGEGGIRFGLAAIKGVGEAAAEAIIAEREQGGAYRDLIDLVERQGDKNVNKRVLEALVKTGAFDFGGSDRAALLLNLEAVMAEAERKREDRANGQGNLFEALGDAGLAAGTTVIDDAGTEPMPVSERLQHEKELLGFYLSGHPMDTYRSIDVALDSFAGPEAIAGLPDRAPFRLCGIIANVQRKYTRKDNRPMAVFNLVGRRNTYEMLLFPDPYERHGTSLEDGRRVLVHGLVGRRNGESILAAHEIYGLDTSVARVIRQVTFLLRPSNEATAFIAELRSVVDREPGETRTGIAFLVAGRVLEAETAASLQWKIDPAALATLRAHPAVAGLRIEPVETPAVDDRRPWQRRSA